MLKKSDVLNRSIALLLVPEDDGTAVQTGVVRAVGSELESEHGGEPPSFPLPPDALERIRPVDLENAEVRAILGGADFVLPITVGGLPEGGS